MFAKLILLIVPTLILASPFPLPYTHTHTHRYWSQIDDALRSAAYSRGVSVRVMGSYWEHTSSDMLKFLQSLADMSATGSFRGTIEAVSLPVCLSVCPQSELCGMYCCLFFSSGCSLCPSSPTRTSPLLESTTTSTWSPTKLHTWASDHSCPSRLRFILFICILVPRLFPPSRF